MVEKIGIVGGLGWRSTVDYYSALHELAGECAAPHAPLEIAIESLDIGVARALWRDGERDGRWTGFDNYHRAALDSLERSGAKVALIACNTPHGRLPQIARGTGIAPIDLFEAVCREAQRRGTRKLLVLGTPTTMRSKRYRTMLASNGIEPVVPGAAAARALQRLIDDLEQGREAGARARLIEIARAAGAAACEHMAVGLHCTELPLAFEASQRAPAILAEGIAFLNASAIHVRSALEAAGFTPPGQSP